MTVSTNNVSSNRSVFGYIYCCCTCCLMVALLLQSLFSLLQRNWKLLLRSLLAHQYVVGTYHTLHTLALLYPLFIDSLQVTMKTNLLAASRNS